MKKTKKMGVITAIILILSGCSDFSNQDSEHYYEQSELCPENTTTTKNVENELQTTLNIEETTTIPIEKISIIESSSISTTTIAISTTSARDEALYNAIKAFSDESLSNITYTDFSGETIEITRSLGYAGDYIIENIEEIELYGTYYYKLYAHNVSGDYYSEFYIEKNTNIISTPSEVIETTSEITTAEQIAEEDISTELLIDENGYYIKETILNDYSGKTIATDFVSAFCPDGWTVLPLKNFWAIEEDEEGIDPYSLKFYKGEYIKNENDSYLLNSIEIEYWEDFGHYMSESFNNDNYIEIELEGRIWEGWCGTSVDNDVLEKNIYMFDLHSENDSLSICVVGDLNGSITYMDDDVQTIINSISIK